MYDISFRSCSPVEKFNTVIQMTENTSVFIVTPKSHERQWSS